MKTLLIGSTAIKNTYPDFKRDPKDIDYACNERYVKSIKGVEYLYNPIIMRYCNNLESIDMDSLLTLKISHLFWDNNWDKHMFDVQFLLSKGHTYDNELLSELIEFWESYLPTIKRSNLVMNKADFFTNKVNKHIDDHDELHFLLNPIPMFTKLLKDGSQVELDYIKWVNLTNEEKDATIYEETAVMAFERYPNLFYKSSFKRQLKDNIIKHFPKYIAMYAIENYKRLHITNINFNQILKQTQNEH